MEERHLTRDEIRGIWRIDRSERIDGVYRLVDGALVLEPRVIEVPGWDPEEAARDERILEDCHDRGGWFLGAYDGSRLVGVAVLDTRSLGAEGDRLQLKYLYVGRSYRGSGLGRRLFARAAEEARRRGARGLAVSATPSRRTIDFYLGLGCRVAEEPDPELVALEPEDIQLECDLTVP